MNKICFIKAKKNLNCRKTKKKKITKEEEKEKLYKSLRSKRKKEKSFIPHCIQNVVCSNIIKANKNETDFNNKKKKPTHSKKKKGILIFKKKEQTFLFLPPTANANS